ncbi:MAG: HAD family hydrolase [Thermodesulfovibrionales bacterium]|nr:HAD family hydrolase [Thermodesulfovibrionales bacterium]
MKTLESNKDLVQKASRIRIVFTDVDGVLTNTIVYYTPEGDFMRGFSVRDGMGMERLKKECNIETVIISGESSQSIETRAKKLGISECYLGITDKKSLLQSVIIEKGFKMDEVGYIGDDINDIDAIKSVGFSACPSDAFDIVLKEVDMVCKNRGGEGAFREFAEFIIKSKKSKQGRIGDEGF